MRPPPAPAALFASPIAAGTLQAPRWPRGGRLVAYLDGYRPADWPA